MKDGSFTRAAARLARRLDSLGLITDEPDRLTRTFLSPAMRRANAEVGAWMREAGLRVREDAFGNLIGRSESARPDARTLLVGSHLDTVRDAGRFDGALGVLLPIIALEELRRRGTTLSFAVEIIGFSEEEGVRFSSAYLGSKGYTGQLVAADLDRRDACDVSLREALRKFRRGTFRFPPPAHNPSELMGYVEVHIEQGPVLEANGLAAGVVSAIAGQTRVRLSWRGQAGHAGTTPMVLRRDALVGAAEFTLAVESFARCRPPLVATVGAFSVSPNVANVIPGEVALCLDVRHPQNAARRSALAQLLRLANRVARRRRLVLTWQPEMDHAATTCSPALTAALARSVRAQQGKCPKLVSGAGHDAVVIAGLTPVAMLFVRCRGGLSHHPDESVARRDLKVAVRILVDFLERLAHEQ
jgi:allantoate deiminase